MKKFLLSLAVAFSATAAFADVIVAESAKMTANPWDSQFWVVADTEFAEGDVIVLTMDIKADKAASTSPQVHKAPGEYLHWNGTGKADFTTEWTSYNGSYTVEAAAVGGYSFAFNLNDLEEANTYYFDNIVLTINGKNALKECAYKFDNGEVKPIEVAAAEEPETPEEPEATEKKCFVVETADKKSDPWDSQMFIVLSDATFKAGDSYELKMDVKADKEALSGGQFHGEPGAYMHWNCVGNVSFGTDWSTFDFKGTVDAEADNAKSIAFNLNDFADANVYYVADICLTINGEEVQTVFMSKYDGGEIVGINNLEAEANGVAYDLFGRAGATKGFMVKGGMKVLVK